MTGFYDGTIRVEVICETPMMYQIVAPCRLRLLHVPSECVVEAGQLAMVPKAYVTLREERPKPYFQEPEKVERPPKRPRVSREVYARSVGSECGEADGPNSYPVPWAWSDVYRYAPSELLYTPLWSNRDDMEA